MHSYFHSLHIFSKMVYQRFFFPFLHNSLWLKPFIIILSDTCLHGPWNGVLIHWGNESSSHIPPQGTCFKGDQSGQSTFISHIYIKVLLEPFFMHKTHYKLFSQHHKIYIKTVNFFFTKYS